jgi:hypothetical protein
MFLLRQARLGSGNYHKPSNEESITLLLRDSANLTGDRIEYRILPGPLVYNISDKDILLRDHFAKNDTTGFTRIDEGLLTPLQYLL